MAIRRYASKAAVESTSAKPEMIQYGSHGKNLGIKYNIESRLEKALGYQSFLSSRAVSSL